MSNREILKYEIAFMSDNSRLRFDAWNAPHTSD